MAPRFTTLMYQVYSSEHETEGIVCFPFAQYELIFPFRDKLTEALLKMGSLQVQKAQGYPFPPDSMFRFHTENQAVFVIETSHDFPCIIIQSHLHSEVSLSELIQEVAENLAVEIARNTQLGLIAEVVTSNKSYDL